MTAEQVDYVNIGLMGMSLAAAFLLPFEVFLFSYAFLGPLHYLTEISWLHDRQYFAPRRYDWIPLVALSVLTLLGAQSVLGAGLVGLFTRLGLDGLLELLTDYSYDLTFIAFGLALLFILLKDTVARILATLLLLLVAAMLHGNAPPLSPRRFDSAYWTIFAMYVPTIIHVYLFTGAFILLGALRRRSRPGYLSLGCFVCGALACFVLLRDTSGYRVSQWAMTNYGDTFRGLNYFLLRDLHGMPLRSLGQINLFSDTASIVTMRFIAFAYTYHYLNWFSKTSIIRWHEVPRQRFAVVVSLWLASLGLYFYSYEMGFRWLFFLSFTHVLLEFPLNHQTFLGIGREVYARLARPPVAASPGGRRIR